MVGLASTPEEKRLQVEQVVKTVFDLGGAPSEINALLGESAEKPTVAVIVKTALFKPDELPVSFPQNCVRPDRNHVLMRFTYENTHQPTQQEYPSGFAQT